MSFIIRAYRPGDEEKILEMFNEVFQQNRDISHWYWKYRDNPHGSFFMSLAFSERGELAAHYGGYPVILYFYPEGGKSPGKILTFHLGDKMTRPEFRGAGFGKNSVLARTFTHFRNTFGGETIPFGYGFGTDHSLRFGLMFLDYADIEPVPYRKLALGGAMPGRKRRLGQVLSRIHVEEVSAVDESWTGLFHRAGPAYGCLALRDAATVDWRYLRRPDRKYLLLAVRKGSRLIGWSAFYRDGDTLQWGDALFDPRYASSAGLMIARLKELPYSDGARCLECWFPSRPRWWDLELDAIGVAKAPEPHNLHLTGPVFHDREAPEVLRRCFYYTLGDSDLF